MRLVVQITRHVAAVLAALPALALGDAAAQTAGNRPATGAIRVQVVDPSARPAEGAEIVLPMFGVALRVPAGGALFITDVPAGTYLVQARQIGYAPAFATVRVGRDTVVSDLTLGALGQRLDPVRVRATLTPVEARLAGFERRRAHNAFGRYVTRDQIDERRALDVVSVLRAVPGIVVTTGVGSTRVRSRRAVGATDCTSMLVFLDGMLVGGRQPLGGRGARFATVQSASQDGAGGGSARRPTQSGTAAAPNWSAMAAPTEGGTGGSGYDINTIPLAFLAGVEVYTSIAGMPPEYAAFRGAECGAILFWTAPR